jgi:outer membrane protein assembly factor BamB
MGSLAALGGVSLLAACQSQGQPSPVPPAPVSPAGAAPSAALAASPAVVASPAAASPVPAASPSPVATGAALAGRPMYQMDPQHTGRSPHTGPRGAVLLRTFDSGSFPTQDPAIPRPDIQSSAAIGSDGTIYIGNYPGNLFALRDPGSGDKLEVLWRFHPPGQTLLHATPALGRDGTVYLGLSPTAQNPETRMTF